MPSLHALLDAMAALPHGALIVAVGACACLESVFPPLPADTFVAFGTFLLAHSGGGLAGAFLAAWLGASAGSMLTFAVGRRMGLAWVERKFEASPATAERVRTLHADYGLAALVISRFLPFVRGAMPPLAGALGLRVLPVTVAIVVASAAWYGMLVSLAHGAGANAEAFLAAFRRLGLRAALVAATLAITGLIAHRLVRRFRR